MKKIILLLSLSAFSLSTLFGQIELDRSDFSYAPATFQMAEDTNAILPADFALGGPNKTWDFSTLANHGSFEARFLTPSAANGGTQYDSCNVVIQSDSRYDDYEYINAQDFIFKFLGQSEDTMGGELSRSTMMKFPLNYGDGWNDSNTAVLVYPGSDFNIPFDSIKIEVYVSIDNVVDAWGKLKLAIGESDVLRLKSTVFVDYSASVYNGIIGWTPIQQDQVSTDEYRFFSKKCGYNLAQVSEDQNGALVEYRSASLLSSKTPEMNTPQVYPNPVNNGTLWVDVQEPINLKVYSIDGKLIREMNYTNIGQQAVSTGELTPGTYYVQFTNRLGMQSNTKIIVQ
ncbi:MAG: T9SS type A sorting domain-containing protein [Bacteroidetes bacterium]|nr:MAG: T9SS type A sorting domain-containing protein [Bacteroidota bacterium]